MSAEEPDIERLTDALARVTAQRDDLEERMRELLYIVSHDLRAPLRHVKNLAEWAMEDAGDTLAEEAKGHLSLINERVTSMDGMLVAMLDLSRVGRLDGDVEEVDMGKLLDDSLAAEPLPEGFVLEREGTFPTLTTSPNRLEQLLRHLIDNAVAHHDKGAGTILVAVSEAEPGWRIEVRDDGPGIKPKQRERALKLFHTTSRGKPARLGVGLPLAHRIAQCSGGDLELEGGERGLTVIVTWGKSWPTENETKAAAGE